MLIIIIGLFAVFVGFRIVVIQVAVESSWLRDEVELVTDLFYCVVVGMGLWFCC